MHGSHTHTHTHTPFSHWRVLQPGWQTREKNTQWPWRPSGVLANRWRTSFQHTMRSSFWWKLLRVHWWLLMLHLKSARVQSRQPRAATQTRIQPQSPKPPSVKGKRSCKFTAVSDWLIFKCSLTASFLEISQGWSSCWCWAMPSAANLPQSAWLRASVITGLEHFVFVFAQELDHIHKPCGM